MAHRERTFLGTALTASVLVTLAACNSILGTDPGETSGDAGGVGDEDATGESGDAPDADDASPCPAGDLSQNADHCGRCGHSCLGGACEGGQCRPVVLAADRFTSSDLVRAGAYVYVAELGTSSAKYVDGRITRVKVDGCKKSCATSKLADIEGAASLALDTNESTFYVAQWDGGTRGGSILTVPLAGGEPTVFKAAQSRPRTIAFDQTTVYWVNGGQSSFAGSVYRAFKDDAHGDAGMPVVPELNYPFDIVVRGNYMYFTVAGEGDFDGEVHRADLTGGNDTSLVPSQEQPRALAVDGTYVYWVSFGNGTVHRVRSTGGKDEEIITGCNHPVSIAVDGERLYIVESGSDPDRVDGRVVTTDLGGKNEIVLASNLLYPRGIRLDDKAVYFLERGTAEKGYRDGTLQRVAKP